MSTTISTPFFSQTTQNPIAQIISGIVQGADLHTRLQQAQDEHAAQLRIAAQQDRENRIQDIQQRMTLNANSRPITAAGTVQDDPTTVPSILSGMVTGTPQASDDGQTLPRLQGQIGPDTSANLPAFPALGQLGGSLATMQQMLPGVTRKADPGRSLDYVTQDGQKISRELYTPQEQMAKMLAAKTATTNAGLIDVPIPPELQQAYGGQASIKAAPAGVPGILRDMNQLARQNETFDISPADQKTYGVSPTMKGDLYDNFLAMKSRHMADADAADRAEQQRKAIASEDDKKISAQGDRQTAALGAQQTNQNNREDAIQARSDAKEERLTNGQIFMATSKKQSALSKAEAAYKAEVTRIGYGAGSAKVTPADKQAQIVVAQKRLRDAKQDAQDAYEESMGTLGKPIEHVEYPAVGEQPAAQAVAPAAATQQPTPPPLSSLKEGKVISFSNGQSWALRGGKPVLVTTQPARVQ
jgi:hypothetical protein